MTAGRRYGVEIRAGQSADVQELTRILNQTSASLQPYCVTDRLAQFSEHDTAVVLVATGYNGLAGLVALSWAPDFLHPRPTAQISALIVDRDERRRGIGRLLLKAASQAARLGGCDRICWAPGDGHDDADAFCRATGFAPRGLTFERSLRRRGGD